MAEHSNPRPCPAPSAAAAVAAAAPGAGDAAPPLGLPHPRLAQLPTTRCVLDGVVPRELARELVFVYRVRRKGGRWCVVRGDGGAWGVGTGAAGPVPWTRIHGDTRILKYGFACRTHRSEGCACRSLYNPAPAAAASPCGTQPRTSAHPGTANPVSQPQNCKPVSSDAAYICPHSPGLQHGWLPAPRVLRHHPRRCTHGAVPAAAAGER